MGSPSGADGTAKLWVWAGEYKLIKYLLRRQRQEGEQRAKARYMRSTWGRGGSRQERAAARNSPHPTGKPNAWHFKKYLMSNKTSKCE